MKLLEASLLHLQSHHPLNLASLKFRPLFNPGESLIGVNTLLHSMHQMLALDDVTHIAGGALNAMN